MFVVSQLVDAGLGLAYADLRLETTTPAWVAAGKALEDSVADALRSLAVEVTHIGSSAIVGLPAKPIVDLAVGLGEGQDATSVIHALEVQGWIYRGDAGGEGGHVLVLDHQPWHRVAHAHVVPLGGEQWVNYVRLRYVLETSPNAREQYAAVKRQLLVTSQGDRNAYTMGKSEVIRSLVAGE